jgi:hypothetical protein
LLRDVEVLVRTETKIHMITKIAFMLLGATKSLNPYANEQFRILPFGGGIKRLG